MRVMPKLTDAQTLRSRSKEPIRKPPMQSKMKLKTPTRRKTLKMVTMRR